MVVVAPPVVRADPVDAPAGSLDDPEIGESPNAVPDHVDLGPANVAHL